MDCCSRGRHKVDNFHTPFPHPPKPLQADTSSSTFVSEIVNKHEDTEVQFSQAEAQLLENRLMAKIQEAAVNDFDTTANLLEGLRQEMRQSQRETSQQLDPATAQVPREDAYRQDLNELTQRVEGLSSQISSMWTNHEELRKELQRVQGLLSDISSTREEHEELRQELHNVKCQFEPLQEATKRHTQEANGNPEAKELDHGQVKEASISGVVPQDCMLVVNSSKADEDENAKDEAEHIHSRRCSLENGGKKFSVDDFTELSRPEYALQESVWDASCLIGVSSISIGVSVILGLCFLVHVTLVLAFIAVLVDSKTLTQSAFNEESIQEFELWRTTVAHDVNLRNTLTGESLASAVCDKKHSLPYSNMQVSIVELLESYLGHDGSSGARDWPPGLLMCTMALFVWYLTLASELRNIADTMGSFLGLPTGRDTELAMVEDHQVILMSISYGRRVFIATLMGVRIAIAVMLAWFGTALLANDISIADMLMNSIALDLMLNLDELIFHALLSRVPQAVIRRILPLQFRHHRKFWNTYGEFMVLVFSLLLAIFCIFTLQLTPFVGTLDKNLYALCGGSPGSLDFVMAVDSIGIPWAAATPKSRGTSTTYAQTAVTEIKKMGFSQAALAPSQRSNEGYFMQVADDDALVAVMSTSTEFKYPVDWSMISTMTHIADIVGWNELVVLRDEDFGDEPGTVYNSYLRYLLGVSGDVSCAQVTSQQCHRQGSSSKDLVMRKLCTGRCGCDSPTTGTVSSPTARDANVGFTGCPSWAIKRKKFADELSELPCVDTNVDSVFSFWLQGVDVSRGLAENFRVAFDQGGCPEAVKVKLGDITTMNACTESSLPAVCPVSCGCMPNVSWSQDHSRSGHYFCPLSCGRQNSVCHTIDVDHGSTPTGPAGPHVGFPCAFPFLYKGNMYESCTSFDWSGPWCAITIDSDGISDYWGDCPPSCA